jgi:hypothetical protein
VILVPAGGDNRRLLLGHVRLEAAEVDGGEASSHVGIVDHEPAPALRVAAARRLRGDPEAGEHDLPLHRAGQVEASADGPGRGEQPVGLGGVEMGDGDHDWIQPQDTWRV